VAGQEGFPSRTEGNPSQPEGNPSQMEGNPSQMEGNPSPVEGNPNDFLRLFNGLLGFRPTTRDALRPFTCPAFLVFVDVITINT
jgi:hypothetical protein